MDVVPARGSNGRPGHPDCLAAAEVDFSKISGYFVISRGNDENEILATTVDELQPLIQLTGPSWHLSSWLPPGGQRVAPISSELIDMDP